MVNHPLIPNLEAGAAVSFANEFHKVGPSHYFVVPALPVLRPTPLKSLEQAGTDEMDWLTLIPKAKDDLRCPNVYATSHAGNECDEAIVNGFQDFGFEPGDDLFLRPGELFRPMPRKAAPVLSFFVFRHIIDSRPPGDGLPLTST